MTYDERPESEPNPSSVDRESQNRLIPKKKYTKPFLTPKGKLSTEGPPVWVGTLSYLTATHLAGADL